MKKIIAILSVMFFSLGLLFVSRAEARDVSEITDWYIKDFQSEIVVNTDSSLHITEKIAADCGDLPNKHGIFRTVPTFYQKTSTEKVNTPVKIESITDFNGNSIPYTTQNNFTDRTITWKIGDANKTVTGVNYYKIVYDVQNAIRFDNANFDEFYWNVVGQFWKLDIDAASIDIKFPTGINSQNSKVNLYTGAFGDRAQEAISSWTSGNTLNVAATRGLKPGEGITASITFPKNIIAPYKPSFFEQYGAYLWLIIPILTLLTCFNLWKKYGRDPKLNKTVIAEYEAPDGISPMEMGLILSNRSFNNKFLSAGIINLAVKKVIKIDEVPKKGLLGKKDYKLTLLDSDFQKNAQITNSEKALLGCLFNNLTSQAGKIAKMNLSKLFTSPEAITKAFRESNVGADQITNEILLSDLKNVFYQYIPLISGTASSEPAVSKSYNQTGFTLRIVMIVAGGFILGGLFWLAGLLGLLNVDNAVGIIFALILTGIIIVVFAILMPQRTPAGAELLWKVKGFELYMKTAEKYREQFNEKENIFEKFLPYAMVFGIVDLWVQKMKMIYGEEYFNTYHPYWYGGYVGNFNVDSLTESINSVSHSMASTMASSPSSSGSGGGGFSGGGGGGGGGGGW